MRIVEWEKPGTFIASEDHDASFRLGNQITSMEECIIEANIVLNMFEADINSSECERHKIEFNTRRAIDREVTSELFPDGIFEMNISIEEERARRLAVEKEVRRRLFSSGHLPSSFIFKPRFIFAKNFLNNVDIFLKHLKSLSKDSAAPEEIHIIYEELLIHLPDIRDVRNSMQHPEDRVIGKAHKKEIEIKEIDNSKIPIKGRAMVQSALNKNKFGYTMANGEYGDIEVSFDTLNLLLESLIKVYGTFNWIGLKTLYPL